MKRKKIFRSLVILGSELRELLEMNGHDSLCDENTKLHNYLTDKIIDWLKNNQTGRNTIYSEIEINELVIKILEYIIHNNLLARDTDFNGKHYATDYYSDLYLINTNENEYGDKHLGTSFRDNGSFGSLPLYDDYSEESDS